MGAGENVFQWSQMKFAKMWVFKVKVLESGTDRDHLKTCQYVLLHEGFILTYTCGLQISQEGSLWSLFHRDQTNNDSHSNSVKTFFISNIFSDNNCYGTGN